MLLHKQQRTLYLANHMQTVVDLFLFFFKSNWNNLWSEHFKILLKPEKFINFENSFHWSVSIIKQKFFNCCLPKSCLLLVSSLCIYSYECYKLLLYMVLPADASSEVAICLKSLHCKIEGREWSGKSVEGLTGIKGSKRACQW